MWWRLPMTMPTIHTNFSVFNMSISTYFHCCLSQTTDWKQVKGRNIIKCLSTLFGLFNVSWQRLSKSLNSTVGMNIILSKTFGVVWCNGSKSPRGVQLSWSGDFEGQSIFIPFSALWMGALPTLRETRTEVVHHRPKVISQNNFALI